MTPTLLELVVTVALLWVAWRIGVWLAPRVVASFLSFWRGSRSSGQDANVSPEVPVSPPHGHLPRPK